MNGCGFMIPWGGVAFDMCWDIHASLMLLYMLTLIMEKADEEDRNWGPEERGESHGLGFG
jgi:hypothetical protein